MNMSLPIPGGAGRQCRRIFLRALPACMVLLLVSACASTQETDELSDSQKAAEFNTSLGLQYMNRGQYEIALGKLKKAVREDPDYAPAHTVTAILYEQIGEEDLAGKHYQLAYEADPEDGDVNNNYGTYLCKTGHKNEAIGHFMRALDDPFYNTPAVALANAGSCVLGEGDLAEANDYLRRALQIDPESPDALLTMATLSYEQHKNLQARGFIQRYEDVASHSPSSLLLAYRVEMALGADKSADSYRRTLLTRFSESEQAAEVRRTQTQ